MMEMEMMTSITTRIMATALATLRSMTKPSAISSDACTRAMPLTSFTWVTVSDMSWMSSTWMTNRSRRVEGLLSSKT